MWNQSKYEVAPVWSFTDVRVDESRNRLHNTEQILCKIRSNTICAYNFLIKKFRLRWLSRNAVKAALIEFQLKCSLHETLSEVNDSTVLYVKSYL